MSKWHESINMTYHVAVNRENRWYVGRVLERSGVTTQGRTLDELVEMLRDAIELMWSEKDMLAVAVERS